MYPNLPGYSLTQTIHRSKRAIVYRGVRDIDQLPVVLKTLPAGGVEPHDIVRLSREHRILKSLELPGVVRAYGLERMEHMPVLVLEDCGAETLASQLSPHQAMPLEDFWPVAVACARVLAQLHQHVIHKDLNPANILWDAQSGQIRLIGFGLASEIARERHDRHPPERLGGTLAYISPEQTGRMNRDVDLRTDLYSLGVTFYLLLTGQLPFRANDPMEWVYCHISQVAAAPDSLNRLVPKPLGAILLKLLAKNPEDRYQSAQGLLRDLSECQRQWLETGRVEPFELGRNDVMAQFQVPQRLYGREVEARNILEAFQAAALGHPQMVLVSGQAGIGKSALVNEACLAIAERNGQLVEGKFDQFQRHMPYAAVAQALDGLVRRVMTEPEERLSLWKTRLTEALGPNGRIAVDLVPVLARILGPTAPVVELNPTEEQNRFLATIQSLIAVFARPEAPLVLFLDDLQWSDEPTLLLIRRLVESGEHHALLLIGAYRDNEVRSAHPLNGLLTALGHSPRVHEVRLGPLDDETLNQIVAEALRAVPEGTRSLSSLIHLKSAGNPFFAAEMLRTLHLDGLITFDPEQGRWAWDLEGVRQAQVSDDVVDFLVSRIQRLAPETQRQLRQAACMGDTFELGLLAKAMGEPLEAASAALRPAIAAGLVTPLQVDRLPDSDADGAESRCRFLHDRVRQAAYALNPEAECRRIHLQLGRAMLEAMTEAERAAGAAAIAQQLNEGRSLIADADERLALARLNMAAARKAKESAAYRSAYDFAGVAQELLPPQAWTDHRAFAAEVFKLRASCAYLSGAHDVAEACYAELLAHTRSNLDKAEVHAMRAAQCTFANRMDEANREGIQALRLLGIRLSPKPGMGVVLGEMLCAKVRLGRRKPADLAGAPMVGDRAIRLAMKILEGFLVPAYLTGNSTLFATTVLKQVNLSLRYGNCDESVSAYSGYAVLLAGLGDLSGAYAFGRLALELAETYEVQESKSRLLVLYTLFSHSWSQPWSTLESWFKASVEAGLRTGDFLFMAYACGYVHLWAPDVDLKAAVEAGEQYLALIKQTTYPNALDAAMIHHQFWLSLRGETDHPLSLSDATFDEAACQRRMAQANYVSGIAIYQLYKLQLACIHADWERAWQLLLAAEPPMKALAGSPYMAEFCLHGFMAAAQVASARGPQAGPARRRLRKFHRQMQAWARHCPENFRPPLQLMEAELARLQGRSAQAPKLFEQAVETARQSGFVRYEAQANEAAARYFRSIGLEKAASAYWRDARDGYARWGALAKVQSMDGILPAQPTLMAAIGPVGVEQLHRFNLGVVPQLVESGMLDLATVWKATQAISGEATFEGLLKELMAILKESAGAQRGVLVLRAGEETPTPFLVQAESLESGTYSLLQAEALDHHPRLPVSLLRYVLRSQSSVVLQDAANQGAYTKDPYIEATRARSVLAMPIVNQGHLLGVLYLENNLLTDAFTPERLAVLQILAGQAAVSLQNVRAAERAAYLEAERTLKDTYARELEARVEERTAELKEAYEQLRELDRLKTNFLSVVSHELRTPLTTIQGFAEFLEDRTGGDLTAHQEDFVKQIQQGTAQLRRLVDDLLDFARVEAGSLRLVSGRFDMAAKVADAVDSLLPLTKDLDLHIEARLPSGPVWVQADAGRLAQVVVNLVGNAIKFTPPGGQIVVALQPSATEVRVVVTDSGIGIDADHLPKLFQRFFQVDSSATREKGGIGLGLSIAQSIVEAHGGAIGVDSAPGQGSTFWFTLPAALQAPQPENGDRWHEDEEDYSFDHSMG